MGGAGVITETQAFQLAIVRIFASFSVTSMKEDAGEIGSTDAAAGSYRPANAVEPIACPVVCTS